jgi:hypothetical protein
MVLAMKAQEVSFLMLAKYFNWQKMQYGLKFKHTITVGIMLFIAITACAQSDTTIKLSAAPYYGNSQTQLDAYDILTKLFRLKVAAKADSGKIKPGKLYFAFAPAVGYTLEAGALAALQVNTSFYTNDPQHTNLSVVSTEGQYSVHNQLMTFCIGNIWLNQNKYDLLTDWRYYQYPSYTYGLGENTFYGNSDYVNYSYVKAYQEILRHFNSSYYFGVGYDIDYHFNIVSNTNVTDFQEYNENQTTTTSSGVVVHFMYDNRTNQNNPKKAFYFSTEYRINSMLMGSSSDWQSLQLEARKYFKLSEHKVLALWTWNELTFGGKVPYFELPSNGWDTYLNTGRGYIQGRFRGPDMVYDEAEFRFGILRSGLLGGVVFANVESVSSWPGNQFAGIDPGEGIGLRVKFNKHSDTNLCIDYGFGIQGSRGVFFNLGEVF